MKRRYFWGLFLGIWLCVYPGVAQELSGAAESTSFSAVFHLTYTWGDFLMGQNCQAHLTELETLPFLSEKQQLLQEKMQTYCAGKITVWDSLSTLFRQNKKALLIDKILKENGAFMGYLKALPFYLFDVHNTTPTGTELYAQLDKIQNAVQNKNPEAVVFLMQDLSPTEQLFFISVFNEANSLIDFKQLLSESEVKND